jgi:hypothetical protein
LDPEVSFIPCRTFRGKRVLVTALLARGWAVSVFERKPDLAAAINTDITGAVNVFEACRRGRRLGRPLACVHIRAANHFMDNAYAITNIGVRITQVGRTT